MLLSVVIIAVSLGYLYIKCVCVCVFKKGNLRRVTLTGGIVYVNENCFCRCGYSPDLTGKINLC